MIEPLLWIGVTVAVYLGALRVYRRLRWSVLHPTPVTIVVLMMLLWAGSIPHAQYASGGRWLQLLLAPAVVALGVPLGLQWEQVMRERRALTAAVLAGSVAGIAASAGVAALLGADPVVLRSLVPRSVTTPIAVEIAAALRGSPALAAAVSVASGVLGAVIGPPLLRLLGVSRPASRGFALGAAAHGIGTARAAEEGETAAAAAGLAIGLMGLATAALAAVIAPWLPV